MPKTNERITHEVGNTEAWICLCGNRPDRDGFFPYDKEGNEMEPAEGWDGLYVCFRCGRIIDQGSLDIEGAIRTLSIWVSDCILSLACSRTRSSTPPKLLVSFLRKHRAHLELVTGVRYSGELGHPFHVVDDELVVLALDHPFIPEGRFAPLMVRDHELTEKLAEGFQSLRLRAMKRLQEIDFHSRT